MLQGECTNCGRNGWLNEKYQCPKCIQKQTKDILLKRRIDMDEQEMVDDMVIGAIKLAIREYEKGNKTANDTYSLIFRMLRQCGLL